MNTNETRRPRFEYQSATFRNRNIFFDAFFSDYQLDIYSRIYPYVVESSIFTLPFKIVETRNNLSAYIRGKRKIYNVLYQVAEYIFKSAMEDETVKQRIRQLAPYSDWNM